MKKEKKDNLCLFSSVLLVQIPFSVVVGWIIGCPMNLDFQMFETATLLMTVLVVAFMLQVRYHSTYFTNFSLSGLR